MTADDTIYKPLYSTREYAERLRAAALRAAAEQGASCPAPESAGQALVLADLLCPLFTTAPSIALAKLADAYRMSARIAWRWDPTTGEFRDPTTGEFR